MPRAAILPRPVKSGVVLCEGFVCGPWLEDSSRETKLRSFLAVALKQHDFSDHLVERKFQVLPPRDAP
jgi:hypothetical protein